MSWTLLSESSGFKFRQLHCGVVVKGMVSGILLGLNPRSTCVILGKLLILSVPRFLHLLK